MGITITEALAEIKTVGKRIEKKREFVKTYLGRQDFMKDPLGTDGGSFAVIARERQSIADLETRIIALRIGILTANMGASITIGDQTRTIEEWLMWRRDVAPSAQEFLAGLSGDLGNLRKQAQQKGLTVVRATDAPPTPNDVVINIDEQALAKEVESMEVILGTLDGQLSLKNATVMIEV